MTDPLDYPSFPKRAGASVTTPALPSAVWPWVAGIGGENRYYYMNALWTVRELLDAAVGGRGLRHHRPGHTDLRPGDRIDSWRVLIAHPRRKLALEFGMRAPGTGVLEFDLEPLPADRGTRLAVTAYWSPRGLPGLFYWYAMEPGHAFIFHGLAKEICRRAEAGEVPSWAVSG